MVQARPQTKATKRDSIWPRVSTAIFSTFGEAWSELRTPKLRVILSLVGIAVAVAAIAAVVGLGELQKQTTLENNERWSDRIATLQIDIFTVDGSPVDWKAADERFSAVNERYGFTHTTRLVDGHVQVLAQLPEGVTMIPRIRLSIAPSCKKGAGSVRTMPSYWPLRLSFLHHCVRNSAVLPSIPTPRSA